MARLRTGGSPRASFQRVSLDLGDVVAIQASLLNARQNFARTGDQATALAIARIFDRFVERIRRIAITTGDLAEQEIQARIDATQRRPDTGRGNPKLRNVIKAEAWDPTPNVATGTVTIGILAELDKTPYWRAQEWGYQYHHTPRGFFAGPGYSGPFTLPNPSMAGQHPLFVPSGKGRKFRRPPRITERRYLRDGTHKAVIHWRQETGRAIAETNVELRRLLAARGRPLRGAGPRRAR